MKHQRNPDRTDLCFLTSYSCLERKGLILMLDNMIVLSGPLESLHGRDVPHCCITAGSQWPGRIFAWSDWQTLQDNRFGLC